MIQPTEAAPYYFRYIDLVPSDNIVETLQLQLNDTTTFLSKISDEKSLHRYAPDKWSIRQVLSHVNDTERVFLHRAFWFARGFQDALPSFDQEDCVVAAGANEVPWTNLIEEFRIVRLASLSFFKNLPAEAWVRTGTASDNPFTVRALAYIIAGHLMHHRAIIEDRYC
jgi:uncharacterized damage-inducible protein DinB